MAVKLAIEMVISKVAVMVVAMTQMKASQMAHSRAACLVAMMATTMEIATIRSKVCSLVGGCA